MKASLAQHWKRFSLTPPSLHIVLGSGFGSGFENLDLKDSWKRRCEIPFSDVEGLVPAGAPGHSGVYSYYEHLPTQKILCFQKGRLHGYEGIPPREVVQTVIQARLAGTSTFLLTNAAGGLRKNFRPGTLLVLKDHVNLTGQSPLYGPNPTNGEGQPLGPRFPDMSDTYTPALRDQLERCLRASPHGFHVEQGVYLGLLGPAYETPAEVRLYASWGLDAVGMSTVWEALALRHSGARIAGLSFISNLGCGLSDAPLSHSEVEAEGRKIAARLVSTFFDFAHQEFSGGLL